MRALILTIALCFATSVLADFRLVTKNMEPLLRLAPLSERVLVENFISYSDCVKRGYKNIALGELLGAKVGFYCEPVE